MLLTIFTPTYNRAYILGTLYESLRNQTSKDFEWIVVDDGSTDDTYELLKNWEKEAPFKMMVVKQPNGGKHRAINKGVQLASGELFFIVDSDDHLSLDAVDVIKKQYLWIKGDKNFCGVCGMRAYPNGSRIGGNVSFTVLNCSTFTYWFRYKIKGDLAEVYRTDIMKKYPFPEINDEKFCPEALVWYKIARAGYIMHFFNYNIYICDYLPDGLTAKITRLRIESPIGAMLTYKELYEADINLGLKIRAATNFYRFYFHCLKHKRIKWRPDFIYSVLGYTVYLFDVVSNKRYK